MKKFRKITAVLMVMAMFFAGSVMAGEHEIMGTHGFEMGMKPEAGNGAYTLHSVFYNADRMNDTNGNELPGDYDIFTWTLLNEVNYTFPTPVANGNLGVSAYVPITYWETEVNNWEDDDFGIGDIGAKAYINWQGTSWATTFSTGFWAPTGEEDDGLGHGYWTWTNGLASTFWITNEFSASAELVYEWHSDNDDDVNPGDNVIFNYSADYAITNIWTVGVTGFTLTQFDDGDDNITERAYGTGLEIKANVPDTNLSISARSIFEYGCENRSEGNITTINGTFNF